MPSRVFTREQVLEVLSDASARQELESVPDFIYHFLRDVFYAVDGDGDGYVTADAVCHALPSLTPVRTTPASSPVSPASLLPSHTSRQCSDAHPPLLTPGVQPTWCSSASFVAPTDPTVAHRPLDLCAFMQAFWPAVSDKMARLVGDTWSQQSSGSESGAEHEMGGNVKESSHLRSPSRRTAFSPSPFQGVSMSPPRASPLRGAADRDWSEAFQSSLSSTAPQLCGSEDVASEQQRLYRETVRQLWPQTHDTPLHGSRRASPLSFSHPLFPPPQRLFSDAELRQLQVAFAYLDRNDSGFISVSEVADALQSLLRRSTACVADRGNSDASVGLDDDFSGDVKDLARAMLRLAVTSTAQVTSSSLSIGCIIANGPPVSHVCWDDTCLSLPVFVRSFQCNSGAFPAELVAWCVSCSACETNATSRSTSLHSHRLAFAIQWMSPLECAVVQHTLTRYAAQVSTCMAALKAEGKEAPNRDKSESKRGEQGSGRAAKAAAATHGLSQRSSVNVRRTAKPASHEGLKLDGRTPALLAGTSSAEGPFDSVAQWCSHLRSSIAQVGATDESADGVAVDTVALPLTVLEASLLNDLRETLFPNVFDFSMAAGTAAEAVLWSHVQAVCTLARRVAMICPDATREEEAEEAAAATLIDLTRLGEIILCDPRYLGLEVLVPLSARLEAVVDGAQRVPRRVAEQAVLAVEDCLAQRIESRKAAAQIHNAAKSCEFAHVLELRGRLMTLSPFLARLITGATRFVDGALDVHDCLAVLSAQVLTVPPLRLPSARQSLDKSPAVQKNDTKVLVSSFAEMCEALLENALIVKASQGWLRYACRRIRTHERQDIVAALQKNRRARIYEVACAMAAAAPATSTDLRQRANVEDDYAALFFHACASCWTCQIDLGVAAHVALVLLATALAARETELTDEPAWWRSVETRLTEWVAVQSSKCDADDERPFSLASTWAMAAICSVAAEVGAAACRSISTALCQLVSESDSFSRCVTVKESALASVLQKTITEESLWATQIGTMPMAKDACARLVNTLVGCCPSRADGVVDITLLLHRWLEVYPLPLPVTHLSLCCANEEVESIYYTLKRLAASEASQRRRSETPRSRGASVRRLDKPARSSPATPSSCTTGSVVVTGITPVCLAELLENDAVLSALYTVSPLAALGVWSGSLCHLETVLRPILLSATGVRVSLRKLHEHATAGVDEAALDTGSAIKDVRLTSSSVLDCSTLPAAFRRSCPAQRVLVAMAVPPAVQHAVAHLFHLVDSANNTNPATGSVTEDQLRSYRLHVPAAARYGWHRFVTGLCAASMAASPLSASGSLSASVLRSHCWRRREGATGCGGAEEASEASVATQRTEDVAATYTCGALLARVGELRACVQAQLLEERREREKTVSSPVKALVGASTAAGPVSPAGTAEWWAAYVEVFCRSYSALSW